MLPQPNALTTLVAAVVPALAQGEMPARATRDWELAIYIEPESGYEYQGCFAETSALNGTARMRALPDASTVGEGTLTVEECLSFCASGGFSWAGAEYSR